MKKRLAMIVTMLMVTVSMAALRRKKDTTADKESVINAMKLPKRWQRQKSRKRKN